MVHWVYILKCEDDFIYVGETTRLFTRFNEHLKSRGGSNTIKHKPTNLIGLYKVNDNFSFMRYRDSIKSGEYNKFIIDDWDNDGNNLLIENHITERLFYERRNNNEYGSGNEWYRVRGGKYTKETIDEIVAIYKRASEKDGRSCSTRETIDEKVAKWASEKKGRLCSTRNPIDSIPVDTIVDRPLCKCNYPSEVKLSKDKSKIYFVCALKNVYFDFPQLQIDDPCDFWQPYTEDKEVKNQYEIVKARSTESWILNIKLSAYKINPEPCISCNKKEYLPIFNNGVRRLCQSCIINQYESLKEKYNDVCLIKNT